jgi:hypothetical protein
MRIELSKDPVGYLITQSIGLGWSIIEAGAAIPQLHTDQIKYLLEGVQLFWAARAGQFLHRSLLPQAGVVDALTRRRLELLPAGDKSSNALLWSE